MLFPIFQPFRQFVSRPQVLLAMLLLAVLYGAPNVAAFFNGKAPAQLKYAFNWFANHHVIALSANAAPAAPVVAACAPGTITRASSPILYRDNNVANQTDEYIAFKITAPAAFTDLWVKLTLCSGCNVTKPPNEDLLYHVGPLSAGTPGATAYFYVHTTGVTTTPQTLSVELYEGQPGGGTLNCGPNTFDYTIEDTTKAASNKPKTVVISAGTCYVMTETGETGTISAYNGGVIAFSPAADAAFNADGYQLTHASIDLNGTFTDHTLYLTGVAGGDRPYTITYVFCPPAPIAAPPPTPLVWISSGSSLKHTDPDTTVNGTVFLNTSKTVSPTGPVAPGTMLTYTITLANTGNTDAVLVTLTDAIPSNTTYVANSTTLNGAALGVPDSGTMPFVAGHEVHSPGAINGTIAAGGTATVTFKVTVDIGIPINVSSVSNVATFSGTNILASTIGPVVTPVPRADLKITKTDSLTEVKPLGTTIYTITVTNDGPAGVTGALLKDPALANPMATAVSCVGGTGGASCPAPANVTLPNLQGSGISVDLPMNGTLTFLVTVKETSNTLNSTFTNTATITAPAGTTELDTTNNASSDTDTVKLNPTAVTLLGFKASAYATGGATVQWRTGYEASSLGFNVYREERGKRVRLNAGLVAGSALLAGARTVLTAGNGYEWADAKGVAGATYWLEEVDTRGISTWYGPVSAASAPAGSKPRALLTRQAPLLTDLNAAANQDAQREWAASETGRVGDGETGRWGEVETGHTALLLAQAQPSIWTLPNENAAKLAVRKTGWYRVTAAELSTAGFNTNVNPAFLQLFADGVEVPLRTAGKGNSLDYVEFYGRSLDLPSTDARIYWLKVGQLPVLRMDSRPGRADAPVNVRSFRSTVERKDRLIYFSGLFNGDAENWFGPIIAPLGPYNPGPTVQKLTTRFVDRTAASATLDFTLQGVTDQPHTINVDVNGHAAGVLTFNGQTRSTTSLTLPVSWLLDGENEVRLTAVGGGADYSLVDGVRLSYQRAYLADSNALNFSLGAGQVAFVGGFSTPNIRVLDLNGSTPGGREVAVKVQASGAGFGFALQPETGGNYLALTDERFERAARVSLNLPSNWRAATNGADFVIVAHRAFWTAANRLADTRRLQGLRVAVVDVEDAYDEFSFGAKTPQAVKDLLNCARMNWARKPAFALFVGDATHDPKNYMGLDDADFVPTKLGATFFFETALDNWFADADGDGVPELALGRLPVRTAAQADAVVGKILAYKPLPAPRGALLVSDRTGGGYNFKALNEQLAGLLPPLMTKQFINRDDGTPDQVRAMIVNSINQATPLLVNWLGHGSTQVWTGDGLLRTQDAPGLTNTAKGLFIMTTCLNGYFTDPSQTSLSEAVLVETTGGAFTSIGSTALCFPNPQIVFNQTLFRSLFVNGLTLGEAMTAARVACDDPDVRNSYVLFGDPTMRLK